MKKVLFTALVALLLAASANAQSRPLGQLRPERAYCFNSSLGWIAISSDGTGGDSVNYPPDPVALFGSYSAGAYYALQCDSSGNLIVGGSGDSITSPNSTLAVGGTAGATTLDFNTLAQFWSNGPISGSAGLTLVQNKVSYIDITVPVAISVGHITVQVVTADNSSNLYNVALYPTTGGSAPLVQWGPTAGTALGSSANTPATIATTATVKVYPGTYLLTVTTNCASACATFSGTSSAAFTRFNQSGTGTTTGAAFGTLSSVPVAFHQWGTGGVAIILSN
ncbi:MAG TPA: hypothetical protein VGG42_09910 [Acidobacteriaceae bacterium]|jgi:hypothetical protein